MTTVQAFDYSVNVLRALLWQYNRASKLESILTSKQLWYLQNQTEFWTDWFRDVFDVRTVNAFGAQVWSRILGVRLSIETNPVIAGAPQWGFGPYAQNFTRGNFAQGGSGSVVLSIEQQRLVLRLRYFQLITRCTVPEINRFMASVFGDLGKVYVQDLNDMSFIVYVFDFSPDSQLSFILQNYDLLPRPATVGVSYIVTARDVFGFGEFNENFENGTFIDHEI